MPGKPRSLTRELIVIDSCHHAVWEIVSSLQVTWLPSLKAFYLNLQAIPTVTITRYLLTSWIPILVPSIGPQLGHKQCFVSTQATFENV